MSFKILYLVLNDFRYDSRVLRAAETCVEVGGAATVFALHEPKIARREVIRGIRVRRFKLLTRPLPKRMPVQSIKFVEAFLRMVWAGLILRPGVVHANDLPTLPAGFLIARLVGARLIYDSHELYSDRAHNVSFPKWFLGLSLFSERVLARSVDSVITVSEGISRRMRTEMGIKSPIVIRNMNRKKQSQALKGTEGPLRENIGMNSAAPIILYQGMIGAGRGLRTLVEAFALLKHPSAVLVFLGNGSLVAELRARVKSCGLQSRVYFHAAVSPDILPSWTRCADLGVHPIEGNCQNHRLCLPNKLFEYIQAGLPVVVTDLPEMRKIVKQYGIGEVFRDGDAKDLAAKLDKMLSNGQGYRSALSAAANVLNWDVEKHRLIDVYKSVLRS